MTGLQIHFAAGTVGYQCVSETQAPLPATRVLRQRVEHIKFRPGILYEIFGFVPAKTANMGEDEKECWVLSDEFSMRQASEWDSALKHYIGLCTIPGARKDLEEEEKLASNNNPDLIRAEIDKRSKAMLETKATKTMLFMLCGFNWKLIVGHEFTGNSFCSETG